MSCNRSILPLLRQAAPRLSRHFFATCRQCTQTQPRPARLHTRVAAHAQFKSKGQSAFLKAFRSQSTVASNDGPISRLAELGRIAQDAAAKAKPQPKDAFFPLASRRVVGWWLLGSAASVFGIVVFGGLTRLTESGYKGLKMRHRYALG